MQLPFSEAEFLDLFGAYNAALWPAAAILWAVSLAAFVAVLRGSRSHRAVSGLLIAHWAWAGLAYHVAFFARINPAARLFGGLFLLQALLLAWAASRHPVRYAWARTPRHVIGALLATYGLLYPLLAIAFVHPYPRTPTFGVPCPTTLFTTGILMMAAPLHRSVLVIPLVWSVIGGSAAVLLGVATDFALFVASAGLLLCLAAPRFIGEARAA